MNLKMEDELYLLAYFDQLTQMTNEKYFFEELEKKINDDFENEERLAVVYLKINNLEKMHNILGFEKSSKFISYLAAEIQKTNKKAESISLYKGNQFLFLYNLEQNLNLEKELENLLKKISKLVIKKEYNYLLNVNLGIEVYPEQSLKAAGLLTKFHNAMYTMDTSADSYAVDNSLIEFEITERSFIELSKEVLAELKRMDFSIALDDFGTGYSF